MCEQSNNKAVAPDLTLFGSPTFPKGHVVPKSSPAESKSPRHARFRDQLFPGWDFKRQHRSADRSWAVMARFAWLSPGVCWAEHAPKQCPPESATDFQCEPSFWKPRFFVYNSPFHQSLIEKLNHLPIVGAPSRNLAVAQPHATTPPALLPYPWSRHSRRRSNKRPPPRAS